MNWIKLGTRLGSIYQKSKKVLAWSEGLKSELGAGFTQFIAIKDGSQYVLSEDVVKIKELIKQNSSALEYINKAEDINKKIEEQLKLKDPDYKKILDLSIKQLAYFYIANESADLIYQGTSEENKKRIEKWRNNPNLFKGDDKASVRLADKLCITLENLEAMTIYEVKQVLEGKMMDMESIKKRLEGSWSLVLKDRQIKFFLEDLSPIKISDCTDIKVIKGQTAFKIDKKLQGIVGEDILVTSMTHPGMLPKIRKMKAVITDEGGVLCHAAITAREFKIPTIIGTKIATKVLKNGDKVEVDANSGVVKILG